MKHAGTLLVALVLLAACSREEAPHPSAAPPSTAVAPAAAAAPSPAAKAEAEQIFASRCTPCHGAAGAGDGPASAGFQPPPRNLQSAEWQASVTDEHIEKIVKFGGAAVGKSAAMPPNPDLMGKPEVITALRQHIRQLKK